MGRQTGIIIGYLCCAGFLVGEFLVVLKIMRGERAIDVGIVPPFFPERTS
jgi:hypothetical protein